MFGLWRQLRRKRLARRPLPACWAAMIEAHIPSFGRLDAELRRRFLEYVRIFVSEKTFIAAGGLEITEEMKVVIAASAVRLVLHHRRGISALDRLSEIVVYPSHYRHPHEEDVITFGEAHDWGIVVLSWEAVKHGLTNPDDGHDTAAHELAHVLDRADGTFNGTPELRARADYRSWAQVMSRHFLDLRNGKNPAGEVLRRYGAQNEAEFFAVATEAFFERPERMRDKTPDLYAELMRYYGCDPAADSAPPP